MALIILDTVADPGFIARRAWIRLICNEFVTIVNTEGVAQNA